MTDDPLRAAIRALLGKRPSPAKRRRIAALLRALADEQERTAAAEEREAMRPAQTRLTPHTLGAGPGVSGADYLRIERWGVGDQHSLGRLTIHIGRALLRRWIEATGEVRHVGIREEDGRIAIRPYDPTRHERAYVLQVARGHTPRINCDSARDIIRRPSRRYHGEIADGALIIGAPLEG